VLDIAALAPTVHALLLYQSSTTTVFMQLMNAQVSFKQVPTFFLHDENFMPIILKFVQYFHLWNMTEIFYLL
jgi:hypothetical protein